MNTPVSIAERITMIRNGQTYARFSKEIDCNINTLRSYERGLSNPNLEFIQSICNVKNVSTEWLIFGKGLMDSGKETQLNKNTAEICKSSHEDLAMFARCTKLEAELELEKRERRDLAVELRTVNAENRQWAVKMEQILRENGDLRERCAKLEERQAGCTLQNSYTDTNVLETA